MTPPAAWTGDCHGIDAGRPRRSVVVMAAVEVAPGVRVDERELVVSFARSGGPGGQHVNTTSTKVELRFDVAGSPSLRPDQRERALGRLGSRLTRDGVLVLQASEHRSQTRNREAVLARLGHVLGEALAPPPAPRRASRPGRGAVRRRLDQKARQGQTKALRRRPDGDT